MNDDHQTQSATTSDTQDAHDAHDANSVPTEAVDSQGTDPEQGRTMLRQLRDKGFDGSDEHFALALGRPVAEVTALMSGDEKVDDDVVMKARGIATQRGVELD